MKKISYFNFPTHFSREYSLELLRYSLRFLNKRLWITGWCF